MSLITTQQALEIITTVPVKQALVPMWLWDAAGHTLAEDVTATRDIPPFNRSAMDGYAVRSADVKAVPCQLQVAAVREAGETSAVSLSPGQCVKIMTGAAVPDDADAVVMIENTESDNPTKQTTILKTVKPFENIARRAEDAPAGSVVLNKEQKLTGQALSVAAGLGRAILKVYQQPTASILQTGGELVEPGDNIKTNQIYNSNATLLTGLISDTHICRSRYLGIVRDDRVQLTAAIGTGLSSDVLILTGGVSKGDFDYVPEILADCGVNIHFHGVAIKPGKPLLFGTTSEGCHVFALPGNPVSVMVCFELYVRPFLRKMMGHGSFMRRWVKGSFIAPYNHRGARTEWVRVGIDREEGKYLLDPFHYQGSGVISSMVYADALAKVPADAVVVDPGEVLDVYMLR